MAYSLLYTSSRTGLDGVGIAVYTLLYLRSKEKRRVGIWSESRSLRMEVKHWNYDKGRQEGKYSAYTKLEARYTST
jgi:hypothetical protein